MAEVFHYDLFGKRDLKYDFLTNKSIKTIDYKELPNVAPNYFFVNKDFKEQKEYAEIEAIIAEIEGKLKVVQLQMSQNASDYGKLNELTKEETALQEKLDYLMERWAYLEELAENSK